MEKYGTKVAGAALAALLVALPADEGGVDKNGNSKPYYDIGGVLTVCYGHTGKDIDPKRIYNKQECLAFLSKDVTKHMNRVQGCITREPLVGQLVSFTSHDFNTGGWCGSRSMREFNKGNDEESCKAISTSTDGSPAWSYVNGRYVAGLQYRRKREERTCLESVYAKVSYSNSGRYSFSSYSWIDSLAQQAGV